ncbi:MAG: glycosyltransferase [Spirochaetota bacterium]
MKIDLTVIIPFLNEKENIGRLVDALHKYFSGFRGKRIEVLFVDDGSTDGSSDTLEGISHSGYTARIVRLSRNFGSHAALRAGIQHAQGAYITFMYADLQDPLILIEQMYEKARRGFDIVWAQRRFQRPSSGIFSSMYAALMRRFAVKDFPEQGFDIVLFGGKVKRELNENIESNSSLFLQIMTMGFRQTSLSYEKSPRVRGRSKWTFSKKIKLFIDSFVAFSYFPIRLVSIMGVLLSIAGFIWALTIVLRAILLRDLSQGWPTLIAVLMLGFGVTNISLGIIAEYLWRTFDSARGRKTFIIDRVYDLSGKAK